jgi:hypothetical protein
VLLHAILPLLHCRADASTAPPRTCYCRPVLRSSARSGA